MFNLSLVAGSLSDFAQKTGEKVRCLPTFLRLIRLSPTGCQDKDCRRALNFDQSDSRLLSVWLWISLAQTCLLRSVFLLLRAGVVLRSDELITAIPLIECWWHKACWNLPY